MQQQDLEIVPRHGHLTRLASIWRSAGWPCRDALELDLLAAGWVERVRDQCGRETLALTDAGVRLLARARTQRSRSASAHERLAQRVSAMLALQGRIVWRELSLRARPEAHAAEPPEPQQPAPELVEMVSLASKRESTRQTSWRMARPDVFSIRNTSVERYLCPMVHEVKTSRADLLSDLRAPAKRACYRWLSCETYYVFPADVASAEEIPADFGIWLLHGPPDTGTVELHRPARHVSCTLPFSVWLSLAKAAPERSDVDPAQGELSPAQVSPDDHL